MSSHGRTQLYNLDVHTALLKQVGEKPLDEAMKYLNPLLELSPKNAGSQTAGFEVYIRRSEFTPLSFDNRKYMEHELTSIF